MKSEPVGLEFPCSFPLKAMGLQADDFEALVVGIVRRHVPEAEMESVSRAASSGGKYFSITVTFTAHSREQLDAIYRDLHKEKRVLMSL